MRRNCLATSQTVVARQSAVAAVCQAYRIDRHQVGCCHILAVEARRGASAQCLGAHQPCGDRHGRRCCGVAVVHLVGCGYRGCERLLCNGGTHRALDRQAVVASLCARQRQAAVGHGRGRAHVLAVVGARWRAGEVDRVAAVGCAVCRRAGAGRFGVLQRGCAAKHRNRAAVVDLACGHRQTAFGQRLGCDRGGGRTLDRQAVVAGLRTGQRQATVGHRRGTHILAVVGARWRAGDAHHITCVRQAVAGAARANRLACCQRFGIGHDGRRRGVVDLAGWHRQAAHAQGLGCDSAGAVVNVADAVVAGHVGVACVLDRHGRWLHRLVASAHILVGIA